MTTRRFSAVLKAPAGAHCYLCDSLAAAQCSLCDHAMCLRHTVFFDHVPAPQNAIHDYVECWECDEDEDEEE
jgi:hypothetical protein